MSKNTWSKFWWQDWQRDPALRGCTLAARGLWMEMLAVAHEGDPPGHLTINGNQPTDKQISAIAGCSIKTVKALLAELERNGVFSRTEAGTIYSRRMVRDHEAFLSAVSNGRKGGNPVLKQCSSFD